MGPTRKVLILAPHTDDGELGCGGTIARLIREGNEVYYVAFSICEDSVPEGFPKDALEKEVKIATKVLGIKPENLILFKYSVRKFTESRQDILEKIVQLRNRLNPDLIFMPSSQSLHQDHITIYQEGIRAFKHHNCLGYDLPWDTINFPTSYFYKLTADDVMLKWDSISRYETQKWRSYLDKDFIYGLARVRGAQIGTEFAEAFEAIRGIN